MASKRSDTAKRKDADVFRLVGAAYRKLDKRLAKAARASELTLPQFRALDVLRRDPDPPMGELGRRLGVTAGNMTFVVDRLVEKGLAERKHAERDRRRYVVSLTKEGEAAAKTAAKKIDEEIARALNVLDAKERDALADALEKIANAPDD
jgi:MarR family transcriptional regulator, 2-MHQ and catechol-resistance regulon repressor